MAKRLLARDSDDEEMEGVTTINADGERRGRKRRRSASSSDMDVDEESEPGAKKQARSMTPA